MSEDMLMLELLGALLLLGAWTGLYVLGGRHHKVWRRWGAGLLLPAGTNGLHALNHHWSPWMLLSLGLYPLALSLGYGAVTTWAKIWRRSLYGVALGAAGLPLLLPAHHVGTAILQLLVAALVSVCFGVANPLSAVGEEAQIAVAGVLFVPLAALW